MTYFFTAISLAAMAQSPLRLSGRIFQQPDFTESDSHAVGECLQHPESICRAWLKLNDAAQ